MYFSKFFIIILSLCVFVNQASASISIDIEPEDLQRIGEIVVGNYLRGDTIVRPRTMINTIILSCKHFSMNIAQLIGIMLSLVGANLLTTKLEPFTIPNTQTVMYKNTTLTPSQICKSDFGCDRNLCWRTCDTKFDEDEQQNAQSWCFTSPKPTNNKFQECKNSNECSPCWDCLGLCHSK